MWIGPLSRLDSLSTCLCDVGLMRGPHIIAIRMSLWAWHVQSAMYRPHEMTVRHVAHWSAATTPKKGICQKYALTSFYPTYGGVTVMRRGYGGVISVNGGANSSYKLSTVAREKGVATTAKFTGE